MEQTSKINKLFAEFMSETEETNLPFETDFNCLLPIIQRIEEQGYVVAIKGISYQIYKVLDEKNPIVSLVCGDLSKKTEMTCSLIVSFIEHLNQNEKQFVQIKNWRTGAIIFEGDYPNIKAAVEAAVKQCVSLAYANLVDANLTRANLEGADLAWANLTGADLTGADLTDAYLEGANLEGANLTGANLTGADLYMAILAWAILAGANLTDAIVIGADLTRANLTDAIVTGTILEKKN